MRLLAVTLFLLVACGAPPSVVAPTKIRVPGGVHYCVKITVGAKRKPAIACTPSKSMCEEWAEKGKKLTRLTLIKDITACFSRPALTDL